MMIGIGVVIFNLFSLFRDMLISRLDKGQKKGKYISYRSINDHRSDKHSQDIDRGFFYITIFIGFITLLTFTTLSFCCGG